MADRIEYQGVPLPSGLPGFGGGTVQTLILPGFNTVVAPLKFGPVVDAVDAIPPDPTPPPGSNPNDPTDEVIEPGPAPGPFNTPIPSFCEECAPPTFVPDAQPLFYGFKTQSTCVNCNGKEIPIEYFAPRQTINNNSEFIYYNAPDAIGYTGPNQAKWYLQRSGIDGGEEQNYRTWTLTKDRVKGIDAVGTTWELSLDGVRTLDADGIERLFTPMKLDICNNGETKTIHILAYQEP
jgi:hypothetical protein